MKRIITEQQIILSDDESCHSYARERIILKRRDNPGQKSFISVEHVNLEPDDEFPAGAVTYGDAKSAKLVCEAITEFLTEVQEGQNEDGDLKEAEK